MNVVCFGDSNTYGYDPRSYLGGRYNADSRWVDILAVETGWTVRNLGENGREIPTAAPSFPADTDLLIVMLGTNDLLQGRSPEQTAERLNRFLSGISLNRSKILLLAPPPMTLGAWVPSPQLIDDSHTFAQLCQALTEQLGTRFADAVKWDIPLAYDGVHAGAQSLCRRTSGGGQMKQILPILLSFLLLTGCSGNSADGYQQITQEEAKEMMDTQEVIILDVREQDEYDSGHIPGAVLLPVGSIDEDTATEVIPEKDSTVLVYCRSGNRSKTASSALAELGYTNIYEFGGISTWPYETES